MDEMDYVIEREEDFSAVAFDFSVFLEPTDAEFLGPDESPAFNVTEWNELVIEDVPFFFVRPEHLLSPDDAGRRFILGDADTVSLEGGTLFYNGMEVARFDGRVRLIECTLTDLV